ASRRPAMRASSSSSTRIVGAGGPRLVLPIPHAAPSPGVPMNPLDRPARLGFELTEDQELTLRTARQFARERLLPGAAERDHTGEFPLAFIPELAALGLLAMKVPVADGGSGLDNVGYLLAMAAIAGGCASTAVILASSNLATWILGQHGSPAQKDRWLRPYADGQLGPASFALSEPHCGSDAAALRTAA